MSSRAGLTVVLTVVAAAVVSCSSKAKKSDSSPPLPRRAATPGDELLPLLPTGADLILEIDLARLRANPVAGPVLAAIEGQEGKGERVVLGLGPEIWRRADTVLMASYAVGSSAAATLVLVRGAALEGYELSGGTRISPRTVVVGPPELVAEVEAIAAADPDHRVGLATDEEIARLRAWAMPAKAEGAAIRFSARLDFDARVELASRFDLDVVPASLSLWSDVADDFALVALLGGDEEHGAGRLVQAVERFRERLLRDPIVLWLGLAPLAGLLEVKASGDSARVIFIVGPTRFKATSARLIRRLGDR